jgi:hypothetical protein
MHVSCTRRARARCTTNPFHLYTLSRIESIGICLPAAFFLAIELHPLAWLGWESGIDEGEKRQQLVARSLRLGSIASWERAGHLLPQPQLVPGGCGSRQAGRIICGAQRSQVVLNDSGTKLHALVIALTVRPGNKESTLELCFCICVPNVNSHLFSSSMYCSYVTAPFVWISCREDRDRVEEFAFQNSHTIGRQRLPPRSGSMCRSFRLWSRKTTREWAGPRYQHCFWSRKVVNGRSWAGPARSKSLIHKRTRRKETGRGNILGWASINLGSRLDWNGPVPMSTWASTSPLPPRP